jgi:hypothetical protein
MVSQATTGEANKDSLCIHSLELTTRQNYANSILQVNVHTTKSAVSLMEMGNSVRSSNTMRLVRVTKIMSPTITLCLNQTMVIIIKISHTKICQLLYLFKINIILKPKTISRINGRTKTTCRSINTDPCSWAMACRYNPQTSPTCRITNSMHLRSAFS